jgi:hypothetical protein
LEQQSGPPSTDGAREEQPGGAKMPDTGATPRRKRATSQAQATSKARTAARSRAQARPSARAASAEPRSGNARGIPALADAALQVAKAPFKLTVAATRKTAGLIGRGLRL